MSHPLSRNYENSWFHAPQASPKRSCAEELVNSNVSRATLQRLEIDLRLTVPRKAHDNEVRCKEHPGRYCREAWTTRKGAP